MWGQAGFEGREKKIQPSDSKVILLNSTQVGDTSSLGQILQSSLGSHDLAPECLVPKFKPAERSR